jgi:hypothetical protein
VDLDLNEIICDPEIAAQMHLPQKQYHKLYKAIVGFCRRPSADSISAGASAFPMAPPPDVHDTPEHVPTLAEMSDEEVAQVTRRHARPRTMRRCDAAPRNGCARRRPSAVSRRPSCASSSP